MRDNLPFSTSHSPQVLRFILNASNNQRIRGKEQIRLFAELPYLLYLPLFQIPIEVFKVTSPDTDKPKAGEQNNALRGIIIHFRDFTRRQRVLAATFQVKADLLYTTR